MIVDKSKMDTKKFKTIFAKKFKNFCSKLPILLSYELLPNGVIIYEHYGEDEEDNKETILHYEYDYLNTVQKNIYNIKKHLYNYFPVLTQVVNEEKSASSEEVNKKIAEGQITLENVTAKGYWTTIEKLWEIEKIIVDRDEIFIRELESKTLYRYRLKFPVVTFLKRIRNKEMDSKEAWNFFINKAVLLPLDTNDEGIKEENNEG